MGHSRYRRKDSYLATMGTAVAMRCSGRLAFDVTHAYNALIHTFLSTNNFIAPAPTANQMSSASAGHELQHRYTGSTTISCRSSTTTHAMAGARAVMMMSPAPIAAAAALTRRSRTPCTPRGVRGMHARCGSGSRGEVEKDGTTSSGDDVNNVVTISYQGRRIPAQAGAILRTALLRAGVTPHNTVQRPLGDAKLVNCRGLGRAVQVDSIRTRVLKAPLLGFGAWN